MVWLYNQALYTKAQLKINQAGKKERKGVNLAKLWAQEQNTHK